jgi:hypothetical protein
MVFVTEMIISDLETTVSHSKIIIADIRTSVCGSVMIISDLQTSVDGSEMIISDTPTTVSLREAHISMVEKMISEAEIIISATDIAFAVSEKTVGEAPAVVVHQQPTIRSCEKRAHTPRLVQVSENFAISAVQKGQFLVSTHVRINSQIPSISGSTLGVMNIHYLWNGECF